MPAHYQVTPLHLVSPSGENIYCHLSETDTTRTAEPPKAEWGSRPAGCKVLLLSQVIYAETINPLGRTKVDCCQSAS